MSEGNGSGNGHDTDRSELGNGDRLTPVDQPLTLEDMMNELRGALGESNALSILAREASARCSDLTVQLLERMRHDELRSADLTRRVDHVERHLGIAAE